MSPTPSATVPEILAGQPVGSQFRITGPSVMKPSLTLLVRSRNGDATALAEVGCRRATELGLRAGLIHLTVKDASGLASGPESVTALVPAEFAGEQHEAWCLPCQLSLLRCGVGFTILVLGAAGSEEFQARQHALFRAPLAVSRRRRQRSAA
jgi:hypothetical protein